jgi:phospholipase/carboxylesterase
MIANFIDELLAKYPIDSTKVSLIGFSQGSILSYAVALSYPTKIAKVVAMSGYLNLDMAIEGFEKNDISGLKIFASHGTVDQVIPVEWARKTPQLLENFGIDVVYKEYPIGHGVSPQNFFDFRKWLAENK